MPGHRDPPGSPRSCPIGTGYLWWSTRPTPGAGLGQPARAHGSPAGYSRFPDSGLLEPRWSDAAACIDHRAGPRGLQAEEQGTLRLRRRRPASPLVFGGSQGAVFYQPRGLAAAGDLYRRRGAWSCTPTARRTPLDLPPAGRSPYVAIALPEPDGPGHAAPTWRSAAPGDDRRRGVGRRTTGGARCRADRRTANGA